jgi:molecular chaperone DnaJ
MADADDYYVLLGVGRDADDKVLKAAFRKKAVQHHPDKNPGDASAEAKFKEVNEAYSVLSDPDKRAAYDRYGKAAFQNGGGGGQGFEGFGSAFTDIFEDLFGDFMGGGGRGQRGGRGGRNGPARGSDMRYNMEITLEEAFKGKTATITVPTAMTCEVCAGSGGAAGSQPKTCPTCGGAGKVRATQGFFVVERTCSTCSGAGQVIANPCPQCRGAGRIEKDRTLQIKVPAGVDDGTRIRLSGEGEAGARGGPSGDLYVFLSLKPHAIFQRDGTTLFCVAPLPVTTAALGGEIDVPSLDGQRTKVKIPAGSQTGRQFRLRGKGMPALNSAGHGDLIIQVTLETPVNLTKKQRELLQAFRDAETGDNTPESTGFFARLKDWWDGETA